MGMIHYAFESPTHVLEALESHMDPKMVSSGKDGGESAIFYIFYNTFYTLKFPVHQGSIQQLLHPYSARKCSSIQV